MKNSRALPIGFLAFALSCLGLLASCGGGGASAPPPDVVATSGGLRATTEAAMAARLREALGPGNSSYAGFDLTLGGINWAASSVGAPAGAAEGARSGTVLQEGGVDEADLIKSDGSFVFSLDPSSGPITVTPFRASVQPSLIA